MTRGVVLHLSEGSPDKHRAVLRNALNLLSNPSAATQRHLTAVGG